MSNQSEELARYVAAQTEDLKQEENSKGRYRIPPPPKPGEVIICQQCGRKMLPQDFSEDMTKRKWEFTWHMHWNCRTNVLHELDLATPGLLAERGTGKIQTGREVPTNARRNSQNRNGTETGKS